MSNKYNYEIISSTDAGNHPSEKFPNYLLGDSLSEAEDTYLKFEKYINNLSNMYASASGIEKSELFGDAILALGKAKRDFDPRIGKFVPFAKFLIMDAMNE